MPEDISIEGTGFYTISARTERGLEWMGENLSDPDAISGVVFSDQTRMSQDIAEGATSAGLVVMVNGRIYLAGGYVQEAR